MDVIDKKLVAKLQENGRITLTELGKSLDLSHAGARNRLKRLLKEGSIKITANISTNKFNLKGVVFLVEVENPQRLKKLIETYKKCPRLVFMSTLVGTYNLLVIKAAEDSPTAESMILGECSLRGQKGIKHSEAYITGTITYPSHLPVTLLVDKTNVTPCQIQCDTCERYNKEICLGCPATSLYRGPL